MGGNFGASRSETDVSVIMTGQLGIHHRIGRHFRPSKRREGAGSVACLSSRLFEIEAFLS